MQIHKGKKAVVFAGVAVCFLFAVLFSALFFPTALLSSLKPEQIAEIQILAVPPEQEVVLHAEEAEQAAKLLQRLKGSRRGYAADATAGQFVQFTVIQTDGTKTEATFSASGSVSINGVSYRAERASAEACCSFANQVLQARRSASQNPDSTQ